MIVRRVTRHDVEPVVDALVSAFGGDPLMGFLFGKDWERQPHVGEFFRILLDVRVALAMPAICAEDDGTILGAAMGYDVSRPAWHATHTEKWARLLAAVDGLEERLGEYGALADRFEPSQPHYYLGVIGVRAGRQGGGIGGVLLESFCTLSARDPRSAGVYLETANEASLRFYLKSGFVLRGDGVLGGDTKLWCVFRATEDGAAPLPEASA